TWTNDSSEQAIIRSDVAIGLGGGGAHSLVLGGAGSWAFNNAIGQGNGTLTVVKNGAGSLTLTGANTYTGGTALNTGTLNVNHASALGNTTAGALTITGGVLDNTSGAAITTTTGKAQNWNGDFTFTGTQNLNFNLGGVTIAGTPGTRTVNIAGGTLSTGLINAAAGFGLTKTGAGTLAMISTVNTSNIAGILDIQAGKIQVSGDLTVGGLTGAGTIENGGAASKWFFVNNGTDNTFSGTIQSNPNNADVRLGLVKRGTGTLNLTGPNNTFIDRFAIENGTVRITGVNTTGFDSDANRAASIGTIGNQNGILVIDGGTLNANRPTSPSVAIATAVNSRGFIQMSSGTINSASEFHIGRGQTGSFAALSISGGVINSGNWIAVGLNNDRAVLNQSGGTINLLQNRMTIGAGGGASIGIVTQSGGVFNSTAAASGGDSGLYVGENGLGHYTLSGTGELILNTNGSANSGTIQFGKAASALGGNFNLNGGTLTAFGVTKGASAPDAVYRFNFNGGTFKSNGSNAAFFADLANTEAYVYGGGAKIDTNGHSVTIGEPLLAPTGSGLSAIALASAGAGYVDTPVVTVTGGTGTGATAVAKVSGGVVTGFTITNPGSGYTPG
ncbi:MAG: PEP-CTERM sorting domain-containing protein, partial [Sphingobacteriales bacterium]